MDVRCSSLKAPGMHVFFEIYVFNVIYMGTSTPRMVRHNIQQLNLPVTRFFGCHSWGYPDCVKNTTIFIKIEVGTQ